MIGRGFVEVKKKTSMHFSVFNSSMIFLLFYPQEGKGAGSPPPAPPTWSPARDIAHFFANIHAFSFATCCAVSCIFTITKYIYITSSPVYVPSLELGLSHPLSRQRVCPSPRNRGGGHSPAGEGLGESKFRRLEKKLSTLPTLCSRCSNTKENIAHRKKSKILSVLKIICKSNLRHCVTVFPLLFLGLTGTCGG
jgi:hypothetical protein